MEKLSSVDWRIHKKLLDGGGIGDRVYICHGRGSGKTETQRQLIEELESKGKNVVLLSLNDMRTTHTYKPGPVSDFDLLTDEKRAERAHWIVEAIKDAMKKLQAEDEPKPMYLPEYEMFKDFYVLDKKRQSTPYLHWIKSNQYLNYTTSYSKNEEEYPCLRFLHI